MTYLCQKCGEHKPQNAFVFKKKRKRYENICAKCWNAVKTQKRQQQRAVIAAAKRRPCDSCGIQMTEQIGVFVNRATKEKVRTYEYIQNSLSIAKTVEKLSGLACVCLNCFSLGKLD